MPRGQQTGGVPDSWRIFARCVADGKSLADSYRAAYPASLKWKPSSVAVKGSLMMDRPEVIAMVEEYRQRIDDEFVVRAADVLRESLRLALADPAKIIGTKDGKQVILLPHELDAETRASIASFEIDEFGKVKYKFWDKNTALERLFKHLGLFEKDNRQKPTETVTRVELVALQPLPPKTEGTAP